MSPPRGDELSGVFVDSDVTRDSHRRAKSTRLISGVEVIPDVICGVVSLCAGNLGDGCERSQLPLCVPCFPHPTDSSFSSSDVCLSLCLMGISV